MRGEKKERILLWQDPEEDQEAAALAAEASVEAVALAEVALAEAALAEAALAARIITGIFTDTIITITARDFSSLDRGTITTAEDIMAAEAVLAQSSVYS